jgi:hypothetical protein
MSALTVVFRALVGEADACSMRNGGARAGFAVFLFPMAPLTPLLLLAMRDLWGWER